MANVVEKCVSLISVCFFVIQVSQISVSSTPVGYQDQSNKDILLIQPQYDYDFSSFDDDEVNTANLYHNYLMDFNLPRLKLTSEAKASHCRLM